MFCAVCTLIEEITVLALDTFHSVFDKKAFLKCLVFRGWISFLGLRDDNLGEKTVHSVNECFWYSEVVNIYLELSLKTPPLGKCLVKVCLWHEEKRCLQERLLKRKKTNKGHTAHLAITVPFWVEEKSALTKNKNLKFWKPWILKTTHTKRKITKGTDAFLALQACHFSLCSPARSPLWLGSRPLPSRSRPGPSPAEGTDLSFAPPHFGWSTSVVRLVVISNVMFVLLLKA